MKQIGAPTALSWKRKRKGRRREDGRGWERMGEERRKGEEGREEKEGREWERMRHRGMEVDWERMWVGGVEKGLIPSTLELDYVPLQVGLVRTWCCSVVLPGTTSAPNQASKGLLLVGSSWETLSKLKMR